MGQETGGGEVDGEVRSELREYGVVKNIGGKTFKKGEIILNMKCSE